MCEYSFFYDYVIFRYFQEWREGSSLRASHAVIRPKLLFLTVDEYIGKRLLVLVGGREGDVVFGVPILADEDVRELRVSLEGVDGWEDLTASFDCQRSALAEIVLRVYDYQCFSHCQLNIISLCEELNQSQANYKLGSIRFRHKQNLPAP